MKQKLSMALCCINILQQIHAGEFGEVEGFDEKFAIGQIVITQESRLIVQNRLIHTNGDFESNTETRTDLGYGVTQRFGIEANVPVILKRRSGNQVSRGFGDIDIFFQYVPLLSEEHLLIIQSGIKFPTGNHKDTPRLGTGTYDFFYILSAFHSSANWYAEFFLTNIIRTTRQQIKESSIIFWDFGIGRKEKVGPEDNNGTIYLVPQIKGEYIFPRRFAGTPIPGSGGTFIFFGTLFSWARGSSIATLVFDIPVFQRTAQRNKLNFRSTAIFEFKI